MRQIGIEKQNVTGLSRIGNKFNAGELIACQRFPQITDQRLAMIPMRQLETPVLLGRRVNDDSRCNIQRRIGLPSGLRILMSFETAAERLLKRKAYPRMSSFTTPV